MVDGRLVPSPNEEVLLYQSMLGIWPLEPLDAGKRAKFCDRLQKFMLKAAREAKTHSSWVSPNEAHENALKRFICSILNGGPENSFLSDFSDFAARIAPAGICNACAQVLLKIASPGVPDFYQGNELWDLRLTDPDNRNPVDFEERMKLLDELPNRPNGNTLANTTELLDGWQDSRLKLYLTREALNFRRAQRDVFLKGDYLPLEVDGTQRYSVCAFARRFENNWVMVVVPRLTANLPRESFFPLKEASWGSTSIALPPSAPVNWRNVFTGEDFSTSRARRKKLLAAASIFSRLPFALLHSRS
jgi:(1->4)-alpha-D-glucan 1-alpha-D-glucosylmutase